MPGGRLEQAVDIPRARQLATQGVEGRRPPFPVAGGFGLLPQPHGQRTDDQRHEQHHGKGDKILQVRDRKAEVRRDKEEVKGGDTQHGGQ